MRPEDKLLFTWSRQEFLATHRQSIQQICHEKKISWEYVYSTAELSGLAPLIYINLMQCLPDDIGIPQNVLERFEECNLHNAIEKEVIADQVSEVLSYFNQKAIDIMLVKGAALELLIYDQPWYTMASDVDLILGIRAEELASEEKREIISHLEVFPFRWDEKKRSRVIEWEFFKHHDVTMNDVLSVDFERIWKDSETVNYRGYDIQVMCPEDMLISVCVNSCRHRYFRLRLLFDIAEIVSRSNIRWDELGAKAQAYQCQNMVYAALLVTKMTVGCKLTDAALAALEVAGARAVLIRLIIRFLIKYQTLPALSRRSGVNVFGKAAGVGLLLPYATYTLNQLGRKLRGIYRAQVL